MMDATGFVAERETEIAEGFFIFQILQMRAPFSRGKRSIDGVPPGLADLIG